MRPMLSIHQRLPQNGMHRISSYKKAEIDVFWSKNEVLEISRTKDYTELASLYKSKF